MHYSGGMFRQHTELTTQIQNQMLRQLCQEWIDLNNSPAAGATVREWALRHTVLEGLHSPAEIVDHIDAVKDHQTKGEIMSALLEEIDADPLAGRILLQAMLPCLVGLARRHCPPRDVVTHEERLHRTLVEFWGVIARGPRNPGTRVAAGLAYDTLRALTAHQRNQQDPWEDATGYVADEHPELLELATEDNLEGHTRRGANSLQDLDPGVGVYELVVSAHAGGVLNRDQAQLLSDVFLSPTHETQLREAAHRLGLPEATLRKRINRIKNILRDAIEARPATTTTAVAA